MVSRLDRLSRKIRDAYDVMDPSQRMGWALSRSTSGWT